MQCSLLSDDWSGTITAHASHGQHVTEINSVNVDPTSRQSARLPHASQVSPLLDRATLTRSLAATTEYLLESRNASINGPYRDGMYLFYDLDARTYGNPWWIWGWGPALKFLIDAATVPELADQTGDDRHLAAARKALTWCIANQYSGPDPHARGGVISCCPHSGVNYRPWFRLCCTYTSGFFGLAALEELALQ